MFKRAIELIFNRRLLLILFLGFSSGFPLALSGGTLQAWFTVDGVDIVTIGFLSLVGQPYVYKFIWAPLLDRYIPPLLGRRRGWMLLTQFLLLFAIAAMALYSPKQHPVLLGSIALLVAFLSASQDIAIDAYRTELLKPEERGLGAAVYVAGYRIAMVVSGGIALVFAAKFGWRMTYFIMATMMMVGVFSSFFGQEIEGDAARVPVSLRAAIIDPFQEFMSRDLAKGILLLIVLYKLGDAFAGSLTSTFLIRGLGFSLMDVGLINKGVGMVAVIAGTFIGGALLAWIGLFRALLLFGVLQAVTNLSFVFLALIGKSYIVMVAAIGLENLCGGMGTAAFLAFLMSICDQRYTASQFALFTALSAIGRVFIGPIAGVMVKHMGWAHFYFWTFIVAIPGVLLLWLLREKLILDLETPVQITQ